MLGGIGIRMGWVGVASKDNNYVGVSLQPSVPTSTMQHSIQLGNHSGSKVGDCSWNHVINRGGSSTQVVGLW